MQISFLGLGVMGYPMAGHLSKNGFAAKVYNRTPSKAERWGREFFGKTCSAPKEASEGSDCVFLCLGNDEDVRNVVYGETGVLQGMKKGAVLVDHTTASSELAKELAKSCAEKGIGFLDAPVSGGQAGAENGALTVMVGGEKQDYEFAEPAIKSYAKKICLMGPVGQGQLTKMMNQICIAGLLQGLAEGIHFAEKAGTDVHKALEVISKGAAQSWQMENRGETMHKRKFDFGFALDWMRKDLGICLETAENIGAELPGTAWIDQLYKKLQNQGKGRFDTSSLIELLDNSRKDQK